jgi:hypothetical protein
MAAGAFLLLPQAVLAGTKPTELEGMVYVKARPIILSYGWQPLVALVVGRTNLPAQIFRKSVTAQGAASASAT